MTMKQRTMRTLRSLTAVAVGCLFSTMALADLRPGYTAFPDADDASGRFLVLEHGWESLTETVRVEISVDPPSVKPVFSLGIYDGDVSSGDWLTEVGAGSWDLNWSTIDLLGNRLSCKYSLYADPDRLGSPSDSSVLVKSWSSSELADTGWTYLGLSEVGPSSTIPNTGAALGGDGKCHYFLQVEWTDPDGLPDDAQNSFKVQADGHVYIRGGQAVGLFGYHVNQTGGLNADWPLVPVATMFDGTYQFTVDVTDAGMGPGLPFTPAAGLSKLTFEDGDFDYGNGNPPDNTISYSLTAPGGEWTVWNTSPSGNKVWKLFDLTIGYSDALGNTVTSLPMGSYLWNVVDPETVMPPAVVAGSSAPVPVAITNALYLGSQYDMYAVPPGNGATRTIGYWSTHLNALTWAVTTYPGTFNLGDLRYITAPLLGQVEAIFWGDISKQGRTKRSALGQARMQLGQQLMAAYANVACLGTSPGGLLTAACNAWQGKNVALIRDLASQLDRFNNSGDAVPFTAGQVDIVGPADPKNAKKAAWVEAGAIYPGPKFN